MISNPSGHIAALEQMSTITLEEMKSVGLMNRIDTKYVASAEVLPELIERSSQNYRVQRIGDIRIARYDTLYYDTPSHAMYLLHHDGHLCRQKIRTRTYLDSDSLSFLEIKDKTNTGRTKKRRIEIRRDEFLRFADNPAAAEFIAQRSHYPVEELQPALRTLFNRITLVGNNLCERLTIDTGLRFENLSNGHCSQLDNAAVIELKRDGLQPSPMADLLLEMRIHPAKISKYCTGIALTDPSVKSNRFKERIRNIGKITNNEILCHF